MTEQSETRRGLVLWGIPPHGGPSIKITASDGQGDSLTREMLMRSSQGWTELAIRPKSN